MEQKNKILVTRSSMPPIEEYIEEIKDLWNTHWLTNMGEKHQKLEKELAKYLDVDVERIALFVNGHQALECILEAFELGKDKNAWGETKNEVITTPFTFASTIHAIVRKGLKPVFCDINKDDYTIDDTKIERLITDRTCAILPVHVYGNMCDVKKIQSIADKYGLKVIYDAAHAFGVKKDGISSACFGDASMFSFHATKVFNTIEGGAVCLKDKKYKEILNKWKNFGICGPDDVEYVGGNAKMNEFCAAMGLCNLKYIDGELLKRKLIYEHYVSRLKGIEGIALNIYNNDIVPNYAYFPVVFDESKLGFTRDEVFEVLEKEGIGTRKYFYPLCNTYACYSDKFDVNKTPVALWTSLRVLTLPLYAELNINEVNRICDIILNLVRS